MMNLASNQLGLIFCRQMLGWFRQGYSANVKHIGFKCPLLGHLHDQVWYLVFYAPLGSFLALYV